jgi:hypothetical protein
MFSKDFFIPLNNKYTIIFINNYNRRSFLNLKNIMDTVHMLLKLDGLLMIVN